MTMLTACGGGGSEAVDRLFGGASSTPILTSIPDQIVSQGDLLKVDVNNIQEGQPGSDEEMSYTCVFDRELDGAVGAGRPCVELPDSAATFQSSAGILLWTPGPSVLGGFEFKITGTDKKGKTYDEIFTVSVRLKFNGIGLYSQITGTSVNVNWTPNLAAQSYQIFKLNTLSGQYELFRTVTGGSQSGATVTGLSPNTGYTLRVQALDVLGNLDGNVVSRSFTTTELVKFAMSPPAVSLAAGTPTTITIRAYNADGSPQTIGGVTLTPQIQSGTSGGSFGAVTDHNDGSYSFAFTPTVVGTPIELEVTTNMSFFLQNTVAITVVPGPPSSANSSVSASAATVVSGQSVGLTATVRDAYNNPITDDSLITFVKSGGSSTGNLGPLTPQGNGVYTSSYTGILAGTAQTLRVAVSGTPLVPSASIQVLAGAPVSAQSTVTVGSATVASGGSVTVSALLKDLNGNPVSSGILVSFNKSGGTSTGTFGSVVNAGGGLYTTAYTGVASGTAQTLSVTVDGLTLAPTATVQVLPGAPSLANSTLTTSATSIASGNFATLTATIRDANNNPISASSTVAFTKAGGSSTGTFGTLNDQGSGVYSIRYNGVTAGTDQTLGVNVNGTPLGLTTQIGVVPGSPSAAQSTIASSAGSVVSGQSATITATLKDANGNLIPSGVLVGFSKTGGSSTGTFSSVTNAGNGTYTATYTGMNAGTAQSLGILIDGIELGPSTPVAVVPGAVNLANSSLAIGSSSLLSGTNTTVTATLRDANNNPISASSTVTFSKTGGTATGTFGSVTNQGSGVYTVTYTGVQAGSAQTIRVLIDGVDVGFTVTVAVAPAAPSMTNSTISVSSATVLSGSDVTVTATLKDLNNNPISSGVLVGFSKTGGTSTGTFSGVSNDGNGVYTTVYSAVTAGSAQTLGILVDGNNLGPTASLTVLPGAPSNVLSTLTVSSATVIAGSTSTLTATIRDANNNPISSGLIVAFDKVGGTSVGSFGTVTNQGNGVYTVVYTGTGAGTANTVQANVNSAGLGPTRTIQVLVGPPNLAASTLTINSSPVPSGTNATLSATVKDAYNNPITTEYAITFDAVGGSSTGDLGGVSSGGGGLFWTTYGAVLAGSAQTIRVLADGVPIPGLTGSLQVVPGPVNPANSLFTIGNTTVQSGTSTTLSMNLRDANNNAVSSGLTLTFNKTTGVSDGTIGSLANNGNGNYSALYAATTQGTAQTITLVVNGTPIPALSVSATVTAGPPTQMTITGPTNPLNTTDCAGPYTVTLKDASNNTTSSLTGVSIAFSSMPVNTHDQLIFSDPACASSVSSLSMGPLISSASFYYKSYVPQSFDFTLTPSGGIAARTLTLTNVPVLSWIGSAVGTFTFNGSGSGFIDDDRSGGFVNPQDTAVSGNYLYVVDSSANRIQKFDLSTQQYVGWLGHIGTKEGITGPCLASEVGDLTKGWCLGSRSLGGAPDLINAPRGIGADGVYLYIVSGSHRILRFRQTTGAYEGWIGRVGTTLPPASGQLATCSGPATNTKTPGWCLGGTFTSGSGDGEFSTAIDVTAMGGKLYVIDYTNQRIQKFDAATGAFEGWMGRIATVPASPASCANASVNDVTPHWCFGGTAKSSSRYSLAGPPSEVAAPQEGFYNPQGIDNDGTYLYIADGANRRIVRLNPASASFAGWIGRVTRSSVLSPTSPSQTSGTYTTTWTQGGVTGETSGTTGFCSTSNVKYDSGSLYVSDACHRVVRIEAMDGQEFRWIGRVATSPTGGETGCSSTPIGGATPGWCLGGAGNKPGIGNAMFTTSVSVDTDANYFYALDRDNSRIQRFVKSTGEFVSWIGATRSTSPLWSRVPASLYGRSGFDDYSFTDMTSYWTSIAVSGDFLFIPDPRIHRIKKHRRKTGEMLGYIGLINSTSGLAPTGPENCVGYTSGMTPDWCTGGGRTTSGSGIHGYSSPYSVAADSSYVYIVNSGNHRVDRVRVSDGLYMGWIGRVDASPTDGVQACLDANTDDPAPTWCIGGTTKAGTNIGMFNSPRGIVYDASAAKLYVTDNGSLAKVDALTGVTEGRLGHVTVGSGCSIAGSTAGGWCTSGVTAGSGTSNYGGVSDPTGVTFDGDYIYISDSATHRILRFDKATGAPSGVIGMLRNATNLNVSAGSGGACAGLTGTPPYPKPAPGWCWTTSLGQGMTTPDPSSAEGAFDSPRGIWAYGGYLYVADTNNHRIVRVDAATGAFAGWKGYITSVADMTDTDCSNAGVGGVTPKWCTGGASGPAQKLGAFDTPSGISGDDKYLYVHDGRNNRLVTIPRN